MTDASKIALSAIAVSPERLRVLQSDNVNAIAESMKVRGQLQDIVLRPRPDHGYWLVAGRHRFEAAKKLGWDFVRCIILEDIDADQAELIEIDKNLIRAELTAAEQAMHTVRRKELYEKLYPETKHGAVGRGGKKSRQGGDSNERFSKETAKKTRNSERKVQRDVTRGKKVKVLAEIAGTCLDKGEELDALAKLDEDEQQKLAERAKAGEKVSAKPQVKKSAGRSKANIPAWKRCVRGVRSLSSQIPPEEYPLLIARLRREIEQIKSRLTADKLASPACLSSVIHGEVKPINEMD